MTGQFSFAVGNLAKYASIFSVLQRVGPKDTSAKTRIKTSHLPRIESDYAGPKDTSAKTRIKTDAAMIPSDGGSESEGHFREDADQDTTLNLRSGTGASPKDTSAKTRIKTAQVRPPG